MPFAMGDPNELILGVSRDAPLALSECQTEYQWAGETGYGLTERSRTAVPDSLHKHAGAAASSRRDPAKACAINTREGLRPITTGNTGESTEPPARRRLSTKGRRTHDTRNRPDGQARARHRSVPRHRQADRTDPRPLRAYVACAARGEHALADVVAAIHEAGGSAEAICADLSNRRAVLDLAAQAGAIDVLVNNAGTGDKFVPLTVTDDEHWRQTFEVDFFAPMLLTRELGREMASRGGGSIVNVSSVAGQWAQPLMGAYNCAKAALESLTRTAAVELGEAGVRANAVSPGVILTELSQDFLQGRRSSSSNPKRRWATRNGRRCRRGRGVPRLRRIGVPHGADDRARRRNARRQQAARGRAGRDANHAMTGAIDDAQHDHIGSDRPRHVPICDRWDMATFLGYVEEDFELEEPPFLPYGGTYRGPAGMQSLFAKATEISTSPPLRSSTCSARVSVLAQ